MVKLGNSRGFMASLWVFVWFRVYHYWLYHSLGVTTMVLMVCNRNNCDFYNNVAKRYETV